MENKLVPETEIPRSELTQAVRENVLDDLEMLGMQAPRREPGQQRLGLLHLLNRLALARSSAQEARTVADVREVFLLAFGKDGFRR